MKQPTPSRRPLELTRERVRALSPRALAQAAGGTGCDGWLCSPSGQRG